MKDSDYDGFDTFRGKLAEYKGQDVEVVIDTPADVCEIKGRLVDVGGDFVALLTPGDNRLKMYNARYIISFFVDSGEE